MNEELLSLIKELKDKRMVYLDEAKTKNAIILPILAYLGWNTHDVEEVEPEHPVEDTKVDYLLKRFNRSEVFVEAKRMGEALEKHEKQLLSYSFKEGVHLAVLTNGVTWWFYSPLLPGLWKNRKFCSLDIYNQTPEEVIACLVEYLSKDNVFSGKSAATARDMYEARQREEVINNALHNVWHRMVTAPDADLISLIADRTEKACSYKPDSIIVKSFLDHDVVYSNVNPQISRIPIARRRTRIGDRTPSTNVEKSSSLKHGTGRHGSVQFYNETYNSLNEFCKAQGIKYNGMRTAFDAVDRCLDIHTGNPLPYRLNVTDENGRPVHYDDSKHIIVNDSGERVNEFSITKVNRSSSSP